MDEGTAHLRGRWLCAGIILCTTLLLLGLAPWVGADSISVLQATPRDLEPIILVGSDVLLLQGAPTDQIYVYAYSAGALRQIPFQVDQVTDEDEYSPTVGDPLGSRDEIVFMASDLGARAPVLTIQNTLAISSTWYQIEVTDPLSPTVTGWAYVVRSSTLTETFGAGYVSFDEPSRQIRSDLYALGFATTHPGYDYLALNGSGIDILDRTKLRLETALGTVTEEALGAGTIDLVKNGPVRVIIRGGAVIGYRALIRGLLSFELPVAATAARASVDFSAAAVPSTLYNANTPAGVIIDGQPDAVAAMPLSPWWQVTGATGTILQAMDTSGLGGTLTNYYLDNEALNPQDPGDNRSYGDTGILAASPNPTIRFLTMYAILPPGLGNVGESYSAYLTSPLQIAVTPQNAHTEIVRLPILLR
jgi:hypothetical protein